MLVYWRVRERKRAPWPHEPLAALAALAAEEQLRIGSEPDCEIVVDGLGVEAEMCRLHCPQLRCIFDQFLLRDIWFKTWVKQQPNC